MNNLIIGNGQIGKPLAEILQVKYAVFVRDVGQAPELPAIDVIHICFPYSGEFVGQVIQYVREHQSDLCIVHSTVKPGTTDYISEQVDAIMVYSPVKGRHGSMVEDLKRYTKFVAGSGMEIAAVLFESVGIRAKLFPSTKGLELAKLLETSYTGVLVAWAQTMKRYCDKVELEYFDLMPFLAEIDYLPHVFQPGYIGGHCIMPNLDLLEQVRESPFLDAIRTSNAQMQPSSKRLYPIPVADFKCL